MDNFTSDQTLDLLNRLGVDVVSDTSTVWMCLCPFHGNLNTPSFAVNKENGTFICFNIACGVHGKMERLIMDLTGKSLFSTLLMISQVQEEGAVSPSEILRKQLTPKPFPTFSQGVLDGMRAAFWASDEAREYMLGRGFNENTLEHFGIGYSPKKNLVAVPMHDVMGKPVGVIGRTIRNKRFENSEDLPKSRTLWNIHRAKRNERGIIAEAAFDAMSIFQATGYDAMATLGSSFSEEQAQQVCKYFTQIVIFTDDDTDDPTYNAHCRKCKDKGESTCVGHNTGLELGMRIANMCNGVSVSWAHSDSLKRYDGKKDANSMTEEEIRYAVKNAVSHVEMSRLVHA